MVSDALEKELWCSLYRKLMVLGDRRTYWRREKLQVEFEPWFFNP
jgi:hypothetical protein